VTTAEQVPSRNTLTVAKTVSDVHSRLVDHWFPCSSVDAAVGTPAGSGRSEKALFTWFASRPIAQARAAVLAALLPDQAGYYGDVRLAIECGDEGAQQRLRQAIIAQYPAGRPVVLDVFSGRGIIPLEAARLGITAVGTDLSPVATLAGRLLADYPLRDWSAEPDLPFERPAMEGALFADNEPRLLKDVRSVFDEVRSRVATAVSSLYPRSDNGTLPWAYVWAVTVPCDNCKHRFPLIGSLVLRHPYKRTDDDGQSLRLVMGQDTWRTEIIEGPPMQEPTYVAASGKRGKSARCPFPSCGHAHSAESVKSMGFAGQYRDALLAVGEELEGSRKIFRVPTSQEVAAATSVDLSSLPPLVGLRAVPDEVIPAGNQDTVRASGYGYRTYGDLMNARQTAKFVATVRAIQEIAADCVSAGISAEYASALAGYAAANLPRQLRRATRGAKLLSHGKPDGTEQNRVQVADVFSEESKVSFNFDYVEAGPGDGPGTWSSVSGSGLNALKKVLAESHVADHPGRFRQASAVALPFRDKSVDAVITDPPYYNMIDYLDASDLFYVWLRRALRQLMPDLFEHAGPDGLQDKTDEIIVKRGNAPGEHRTREFYERMLGRAFGEARRVLRADGHLVVVFGHSDPDAWRRLLGALHDAGFIVTSSWPSRTETSSTGVASIKVTIAIGCRVAAGSRPVATAAQVDREVAERVKAAAREWDRDGLALPDQLMAAYGPAMEVYGHYASILKPDGGQAELDRYLTLARTAVRDATALKLDELPLETFDAPTRFAVFWQRLFARSDVPKGEARFQAQADNLRLEELRGALLTESKSGYRLRIDAPASVSAKSSTFEVVRAMAAAWDQGATEGVAAVIAYCDRQPTDAHLWAVVGEIVAQLPASDAVAKALTAIQRNAGTVANLAQRFAASDRDKQLTLLPTAEES
jgi:adenine-specific DNA methylase